MNQGRHSLYFKISRRFFASGLTVLFVLSFSTPSHSAEKIEFFNGVRSLGMGGVSVAVVNDETALLANPAALGKVRDFYGTIFDPEVGGGMNLNTMYAKKVWTELYNPKDVYKTLDKSRENYYHNQAQLFPSIVVRNFGFGVFGRNLLNAEVNADGDDMRIDYIQDYAAILGISLRLWDGRIKIGANGKMINRAQIAKNVNPTTDNLSIKSNASEGIGFGSDVGLILTAPWALLPTLSVVARDVGKTKFTQKGMFLKSDTRPETLEQDYDVGLALFPIHSPNWRSTFALEYKSVLAAADETDKSRFYHVGYEVNVGDIMFFRMGMNQRYYTLGAEFASEHMQLQFAWYGEEIGVAGAPREDRRAVGKLAYRF